MPVLDNPKHEIFARSVAAGKTQTEAVIAADYSATDAKRQGTRLSTNVHIRARITELQQGIANRATWDAAKVLQRLGEIVDADIADIYADDKKLKPLSEWPAYWRRLVSRMEFEERYERSKDGGDSSWDPSGQLVKIHGLDRLKALELIGRHKAVDAFVAQQGKLDVTINLAEQIGQALDEGRQRARLRLVNRPA